MNRMSRIAAREVSCDHTTLAFVVDRTAHVVEKCPGAVRELLTHCLSFLVGKPGELIEQGRIDDMENPQLSAACKL
jgi:hypothetical protein